MEIQLYVYIEKNEVKYLPYIIQTRAVAKGHVWVHGPGAAKVCVDVCGS